MKSRTCPSSTENGTGLNSGSGFGIEGLGIQGVGLGFGVCGLGLEV